MSLTPECGLLPDRHPRSWIALQFLLFFFSCFFALFACFHLSESLSKPKRQSTLIECNGKTNGRAMRPAKHRNNNRKKARDAKRDAQNLCSSNSEMN
jgi:hypothetical protein